MLQKLLPFIRRSCLAVGILWLLAGPGTAWGQVFGTKSIPGDYATVAAAIADLNAVGVGADGVTFNVAAGSTETLGSLTAGRIQLPVANPSTPTSPIVFRKVANANPAITANPLITGPLNGTGSADYIINLVGTDYITFNGIDLRDNAANATNTTKAEFGYYLTRASGTDGCQNVQITNCGITLDRANNNTIGIFSTSNIQATSTAGTNSNNKFNGNVISNAAGAFSLAGNTTFSATLLDVGNEIGTTAGNILTNIGAPSSGVYGIRVDGQSGLKIENNTLSISTATGASNTIQGIACGVTSALAFSGALLINNNTISITGTTTSNTGINYGIRQSATTNLTSVTITNNRIQNCSLVTSADVRYIVDESSNAALNSTISGNTISNNSAASTGTVYGIYRSGATSASATIGSAGAGNVIQNNTCSGAAVFLCAVQVVNQPAASVVSLSSNTISGNTVSGSGGTRFLGLNVGTGLITATGNAITNNSLAGTSGTTAAVFYGYTNQGSAASETITGNTITGNSVTGTNTAATVMYGLASSSTNGVKNFSQNTIGGNTLGAAGGGVSGELRGISIVAGTTNPIAGNKIYGNTAYGTGGRVVGIFVSGSTSQNLTNNLIGDLNAPQASDANALVGISTVGAGQFYYNTVYLNGSSSGTNFGTSGIFLGTTSNTVDLRNNLVVNTSTARGTGVTAALRRLNGTTGTAPANLAAGSNNNLYYAGPPTATNLVYVEGTTGTLSNASLTLGGYQTLVAPREASSVTGSVTFASTTGTDATFLHFAAGSSQPVESAGQVISVITTDYDNDARGTYPNGAANGGGTAPDIGADEGDFAPVDRTPPAITITAPLGSQGVGAGPTLTGVTITDASGVNVATGTLPRLYYKLSTDPNTFNDNTSGTAGWKFVESSNTTSPFSFTIDYSLLPAVPVAGNTIQYFVVAQDLAATPNVGIDPAATFASTPASVALTAAAFPIGGTPRSYAILPAFSGTVNVGAGNTYTSLTSATGSLFNALNGGVLTGNLTVLVTSDLVEDGTFELKPLTEQPSGSNYTITIQPSAATERLIGGVIVGGIRLNGADRVTFDGRFGGSGRYLRFRNTSTTAPVMILTQDATSNTIRDSYLEGAASAATSGVVVLGTSTSTAVNGVTGGAAGNSAFQLLSCDVRDRSDATGQPTNGLYSGSSAGTAANANATIQGCNFYNFSLNGVLTNNATGSGWTIGQDASGNGVGNSFYSIVGGSLAQTSLNLLAATTATGWLVRGNYVGGNAPQAAGLWTNTGNVAMTGILVNAGTSGTAVTLQENTIRNVRLTNAGTSTRFTGMLLAGATTHLTTGNLITDITNAGAGGGASLGFTNATPTIAGIISTSTAISATGQTISGNTISNLSLTNTVTDNQAVVGITVTASAAFNGLIIRNRLAGLTSISPGANAELVGIHLFNGSWKVYNNQIALSNGTNTNAQGLIGLLDNTTSGQSQAFYFNSVLIGGAAAGGAQKSYAYLRTTNSTLVLQNNVLVNQRTGGTGAHFALGLDATASRTSNYNDLFAATAATLGEVGTTAYTFAGWQATTGNPDANSKNVRVKFVDAAAGNLNLDPTTNCQLDNAGLVIAGINGEFDNAATSRQTTPDLGSDEFGSVPQAAALASTTAQAVCPGGTGTLTLSLAGNGSPFTVMYTDGTTPATVTNATNGQAIAVPLMGSSTTYSLVSATDAYGCTLSLTPGNSSLTLNEATTTTWAGTASNDWFAAANWTNCIPSNTMDALIPAGLTNYPSLNTAATAAVRTLTIASGASLTQSAGTLNVYGSLNSNTPAANLSLTGGTLAFRGATPGMTGVAGLASLVVNLSSPTATLALANDLTAIGTVSLSQGLLNTGAFTLTLPVGAAIAETDASYVLGKVAAPGRSLSSATAENFGGIGLVLTPDAASTVFPGPTPVVRTTGTALAGAGTSQSITRYFDIQPATNTGLSVTMDFSYLNHELNGIAPAKLLLFRSVSGVGGPWGYLRPDAVASNTVTKAGISDFSIWTLGDATNPLPVELSAFTATREGGETILAWATASERNSRGFEVQLSTDGRSYRVLGFVASASPTSTARREYAFRDREAGKTGLRYYRLHQLDMDGTGSFSPVRTVRFGGEASAALVLTAAPNPFREQLLLTVSLPEAAATAELRLTDAAGRVQRTQRLDALPACVSEVELLGSAKLASGVYFVQLAVPGLPVRHLRVLKE